MMDNAIQLSDFQLDSLARIFSPTIFKELANKGESPALSRLVDEVQISKVFQPNTTVYTFFDRAFTILKDINYRNEFVYKSVLTNKVLLGKHSIRTASMLTEFRVGNSKADVLILNGKSTVYEIKSERDNLLKLNKQLNDYLDVFSDVNVIIGKNHLQMVLDSIPHEVGILILSDRFQISTIRESTSSFDRIIPSKVYDCLQIKEVEKILDNLEIDYPLMPNTKKYSFYKELFIKIPKEELHKQFRLVLKESRTARNLEDFIFKIPESLRTNAISLKPNNAQRKRINSALSLTLKEIPKWQ